eukprot:4393277-Pyramimonas_sp.AAC.1
MIGYPECPQDFAREVSLPAVADAPLTAHARLKAVVDEGAPSLAVLRRVKRAAFHPALGPDNT